MSDYKVIDNEWAMTLSELKVTVDIKMNYDIGSRRPALFDVSYIVDDVLTMQSIKIWEGKYVA